MKEEHCAETSRITALVVNRQACLCSGGCQMKDEIFQELIESIREAEPILCEEKEPSRVFVIKELDIKAIRKRYNISQEKLAT
jgi:hypothetical protein